MNERKQLRVNEEKSQRRPEGNEASKDGGLIKRHKDTTVKMGNSYRKLLNIRKI